MHLRCLVCLLSAFAAALPASAGVFVTYSDLPTPGMNGYVTRTFTASSDQGPIFAANFYTDPGYDLGFYGTFNQLKPFNIDTTLNGVDPLIYAAAGMDIAADTHFLISPVDYTVLVPGESTEHLQAVWLDLTPGDTIFPFAQIVTPWVAPMRYAGIFFVGSQTASTQVYVEGEFLQIPEPTASVLLTCGLIGLAMCRSRSASDGRSD
jgi:hypothetical protein